MANIVRGCGGRQDCGRESWKMCACRNTDGNHDNQNFIKDINKDQLSFMVTVVIVKPKLCVYS